VVVRTQSVKTGARRELPSDRMASANSVNIRCNVAVSRPAGSVRITKSTARAVAKDQIYDDRAGSSFNKRALMSVTFWTCGKAECAERA